jgi:DNA-binding response OmpR family regulator
MADERPRVLLVDDEPGILDLLEMVLVEAGFEVLRAASGVQAVRLLDMETGQIRALVTDVRLPGAVDGWELARRARSLAPQISVVYVTGDSEINWAASGVPNSLLVAKPFAPAQVVTAIASLLNVGGG